ncbi:MAG: hypothetical protein ACXABY_27185, partial [Candidatus Thorarchaeota archaeon]
MRGSFDFTRSKAFIIGLIIVLLALLLSPPFTGWWISRTLNMDIGIGSLDSACLYFIEPLEGDVIEASRSDLMVEISNCGSTDLDGKLVVEIMNSLAQTVDYINSSNYSLFPSQYYILNTTWIANLPLGNYTIYARDYNYNANNTNEINQSFEIKCSSGTYKCFGDDLNYCAGRTRWAYYTTCNYMCRNRSCVASPGATIESVMISGGPTVTPRLDLEYSEYIEIPQGSEQTILIKVINNGTAVLSDIVLNVSSDGVGIDVPDMIIERLSPNSSAFFIFDVNTVGSVLGNYTVDFEVRSNMISVPGRIIINVRSPYDDRAACENMISYYVDMLDTMNQEVKSIELKGLNMSDLRDIMVEAADDIEAAKAYLRLGVYSKCIDLTDPLREKIERIAEIIVTIITEEEISGPV